MYGNFFILQINSNRHVTHVSCKCVTNQSGKCKHVYAVIHHINFNESLSKTSYEQTWGTPTARQLRIEKYAKGQFFHEMYPTKPIKEVPCYELTLEDLQDIHCPLRSALCEEVKDKVYCFIKTLLQSIIENMFVQYDLSLCEACLESLLIHKEETPIFKCKHYKSCLAENLRDFYEENVVLNEKQIVKLNQDTLGQANSSKLK